MPPADDTVLISALQHYIFCPRQFAIIHVDQYWQENFLTADGRRLHERVDLPGNHRGKGARVEYALLLVSQRYGLSGKADAVEFLADGQVVPIEYKRGCAKADDSDKVQLCAQALCLEEMLHTQIRSGALFYFEKREKIPVPIDDELRQETVAVIEACRKIINGEKLSPPVKGKKCRGCSLVEYCMPGSSSRSAAAYLQKEVVMCENS